VRMVPLMSIRSFFAHSIQIGLDGSYLFILLPGNVPGGLASRPSRRCAKLNIVGFFYHILKWLRGIVIIRTTQFSVIIEELVSLFYMWRLPTGWSLC